MRLLFGLIGLIATIATTRAEDDAPFTDGLFPLAVGNRWVYRLPGQDDRLSITVAATEKIGEVVCFRLEGRFQNRMIATEHIALHADGVYRHRNDGVDLEPPLPIFKFTAKSRESWQADYKVNDKRTSIIYECDQETVTVPAGTFDAAVVRANIAEGPGRLKSTVWYVPKLGMVKQVIVDGDQTITLVLDRFERAGDIPTKNSPKKNGK